MDESNVNIGSDQQQPSIAGGEGGQASAAKPRAKRAPRKPNPRAKRAAETVRQRKQAAAESVITPDAGDNPAPGEEVTPHPGEAFTVAVPQARPVDAATKAARKAAARVPLSEADARQAAIGTVTMISTAGVLATRDPRAAMSGDEVAATIDPLTSIYQRNGVLAERVSTIAAPFALAAAMGGYLIRVYSLHRSNTMQMQMQAEQAAAPGSPTGTEADRARYAEYVQQAAAPRSNSDILAWQASIAGR